MQDTYAFDVGDFGKLGLLREIAGSGRRIGVLWWKTSLGSAGDDGKHVGYLNNSQFRRAAPELWDQMRKLFNSGSRSIAALHQLLPNDTLFHSSPVPNGAQRAEWFADAMTLVGPVDVVFCDPDNGVVFDETCGSPRHISLCEIRQLFENGRSLVIYHHLGRSTSHDEQIRTALDRFGRELPQLGASWGARFRRGSSRVFFVLAQQKHATDIGDAIERMRSSAWTRDGHFEIVDGPGQQSASSELNITAVRRSLEELRSPQTAGLEDLGHDSYPSERMSSKFDINRAPGRPDTARPPLLKRAVALSDGRPSMKKGTTAIGFENRNKQTVLRKTDTPGNDLFQVVYVLRCQNCEREYGANGSDIFQRRCPYCDPKAKGLDLLISPPRSA